MSENCWKDQILEIANNSATRRFFIFFNKHTTFATEKKQLF